MTGTDHHEPGELAAGAFSTWLAQMQVALERDGESDVPCNGCTACCTSSQFVHVAPDENEALAHIPSELLFPAPGRPAGFLLMGYDEQGHCPMLVDRACSVYEHRPCACRTYDCRIFPATGIFPTEPAKAAIAQQARRWRFRFPTPNDEAAHQATLAAARAVETQGEGGATRRAVVAIRSLSGEGSYADPI